MRTCAVVRHFSTLISDFKKVVLMKVVYTWNMYKRYNVSRKSFLIVLLMCLFFGKEFIVNFLKKRFMYKNYFNSAFARRNLDCLRLKILLKVTSSKMVDLQPACSSNCSYIGSLSSDNSRKRRDS